LPSALLVPLSLPRRCPRAHSLLCNDHILAPGGITVQSHFWQRATWATFGKDSESAIGTTSACRHSSRDRTSSPLEILGFGDAAFRQRWNSRGWHFGRAVLSQVRTPLCGRHLQLQYTYLIISHNKQRRTKRVRECRHLHRANIKYHFA